MKVVCDVCQRSEATMLCCADEAALCECCDEKVHAANKLAEKHQRVPLLSRSSSQSPNCDICQEKTGYIFCLEDRALLCHHCDVAIHTASPYVSSHQRFLVTGVRVALQRHLTKSISFNGDSSNSNGNNSSNLSCSPVSNTSPADKMPATAQVSLPMEAAEDLEPQWPWNEIITGEDFDQRYGFS